MNNKIKLSRNKMNLIHSMRVVRNILSVLVLVTITLLDSNLYANINCKDADGQAITENDISNARQDYHSAKEACQTAYNDLTNAISKYIVESEKAELSTEELRSLKNEVLTKYDTFIENKNELKTTLKDNLFSLLKLKESYEKTKRDSLIIMQNSSHYTLTEVTQAKLAYDSAVLSLDTLNPDIDKAESEYRELTGITKSLAVIISSNVDSFNNGLTSVKDHGVLITKLGTSMDGSNDSLIEKIPIVNVLWAKLSWLLVECTLMDEEEPHVPIQPPALPSKYVEDPMLSEELNLNDIEIDDILSPEEIKELAKKEFEEETN